MKSAKYHVIRRGNIVAGIIGALIALVALASSADAAYPSLGRVTGILVATACTYGAVRLFQPSVTVDGRRLKVRRFFRTSTVESSDVREVVVIATHDGPIEVRKLAIATLDGSLLKSHYQSRRPLREGRVTATDNAAAALRQRLRVA